jgi:hypothetical protein
MSKRSTASSESSVQGTDKKTTHLRLPMADNTPEALAALLAANISYRQEPWPAPFDTTSHKLHLGDARNLSWIADESVHLVVSSPPYWTLKEYNQTPGQMGHIEDYKQFLDELDKVWAECRRVLVPGGRICCVVGDVCIPRSVAAVKCGRNSIGNEIDAAYVRMAKQRLAAAMAQLTVQS